MVRYSPLVIALLVLQLSQTRGNSPADHGELLWSKALEFGNIDNGITYANGYIYISTSSCGVHVLDVDEQEFGTIDPVMNTSCPSGLAFDKDESFFVQARQVLDETDVTEIKKYNSNLEQLWADGRKTIPGLVEGTPIVSSDGLYTFFVSNSMNKTKAHFLVVQNSDASIVFREDTPNGFGREIAYAPLGVGRNVTRGNWNGAGGNSNDVLIWGELYVEGRGERIDGVMMFNGTDHFFQLPIDFDPAGDNTGLTTRKGNELMKVTSSAPAVPKHGRGAYFSFHSGQVRGWSFDHYFGKSPSVKMNLDKELNNPIPGPNGGTLIFNDTRYLIAGPSGSNHIYGYELLENITDTFSSEAVEVWRNSTAKHVKSSLQTAFNDSLTYYIESGGGDLVCVNTLDGMEQWRHTTGGDVVADFTIIEDEYLMFGTTNGYTSLFRIGNQPSERPSFSPSESPTSSSIPSNSPSTSPTNAEPSPQPSSVQTSVPSLRPSSVPSTKPTQSPTSLPTGAPTSAPSKTRTPSPTIFPTPSGTYAPTIGPTKLPSGSPVETNASRSENSLGSSMNTSGSTRIGNTFHFGVILTIVLSLSLFT